MLITFLILIFACTNNEIVEDEDCKPFSPGCYPTPKPKPDWTATAVAKGVPTPTPFWFENPDGSIVIDGLIINDPSDLINPLSVKLKISAGTIQELLLSYIPYGSIKLEVERREKLGITSKTWGVYTLGQIVEGIRKDVSEYKNIERQKEISAGATATARRQSIAPTPTPKPKIKSQNITPTPTFDAKAMADEIYNNELKKRENSDSSEAFLNKSEVKIIWDKYLKDTDYNFGRKTHNCHTFINQTALRDVSIYYIGNNQWKIETYKEFNNNRSSWIVYEKIMEVVPAQSNTYKC